VMNPASASRRATSSPPPSRVPNGERVGRSEAELLPQHVETAGVQRGSEGLRVGDHLARVGAAEGEMFRETDGERRHRVQMVVARHAREGRRCEALRDLRVVGVGEQDPVLRAGERLVRRGGEDLTALVERVLELSAGDQPEDVGRVVPSDGPDLLERRLKLFDR